MVGEVVITGMGAVTPMGRGFGVLLDNWLAGKTAGADSVARCEDFDPHETMSRKEIRRSDVVTQYAVDASVQAVEQAGWDVDLPEPPARIGCIVGTAFGGLDSIERELRSFREQGPHSISPHTMPRCMHNATVSVLATRLGLHGPTQSVVSACASGTDALGVAMHWIREGHADAVLAGGCDRSATDFIVSAFRLVGTLSPTGVARPFDVDRDGFVMGEGAGMFAIERRETAAARGAEILGELRGYGGSSDGFHPTSPDPHGRFAAQSIRVALEDAGARPEDVVYVNAHGTGTRLNDRSETRAIKAALGDAAYRVPVSSTKSVIGHAMGAAGAVEAGVTALAMYRGVVPPTVNHRHGDADLDLDYVPTGGDGPVTVDASTRNGNAVAISNSFGFGGHNGVLCMGARGEERSG